MCGDEADVVDSRPSPLAADRGSQETDSAAEGHARSRRHGGTRMNGRRLGNRKECMYNDGTNRTKRVKAVPASVSRD